MFKLMAAICPKVTPVLFVCADVCVNSLNTDTWLIILAKIAHYLSRRPLFLDQFGAYKIAYIKCQISVILQSTLAVCGFNLRLLPVVAALTTVAL